MCERLKNPDFLRETVNREQFSCLPTTYVTSLASTDFSLDFLMSDLHLYEREKDQSNDEIPKSHIVIYSSHCY